MAEFYEMPAVSPTMEFGVLVEWKIAEGAAFQSGAVIAEVGTDKANMEAEIFDDGVLIKHLVPQDAEVPPGYPIAIWGVSADEDITELLAEFERRKTAAETSSSPAAVSEPVEKLKPAPVAAPAMSSGRFDVSREWMGKPIHHLFFDPPGDLGLSAPSRRTKATPLARKVAQSKGIELSNLVGSGPGGRITRADVDNARPAASGVSVVADEIIKNSPMRKTIARRLLESHQDIPTFFLTATFDMTGCVQLRKELKAKLPDVRVSYNDIVVLAVAKALVKHPDVNASWGDQNITRHGAVDIGIAVAIKDGLITPVLRSANQMSLSAIGTTVRELATRAKDLKLAPEEYTGSTFTISNLGMFGIEQFTAIINPPEAAILAVGAISEVAVVRNGALTVGHQMKVTMTCDHRVVDGAVGASFLKTLRTFIESPSLLLV